MSERSAGLQAIAGHIKKASEAACWGRNELPNRAGVSRPSVARIDAGGDVNTATLRKIGEVLSSVQTRRQDSHAQRSISGTNSVGCSEIRGSRLGV